MDSGGMQLQLYSALLMPLRQLLQQGEFIGLCGWTHQDTAVECSSSVICAINSQLVPHRTSPASASTGLSNGFPMA